MEKWVSYHDPLRMLRFLRLKKSPCMRHATDTFYRKRSTRQYNSKDTCTRAAMTQWAVGLLPVQIFSVLHQTITLVVVTEPPLRPQQWRS